MKLTAVILTKNEEANIDRSLESVAFCDEILIVDDNSDDKTVAKAKILSEKVKVVKRRLNGDFASQRNFALEQASGRWILFVDADEEVTAELQREIQSVIQQNSQFPISNFQINSKSQIQNDKKENSTGAYYLKRRDYFWARELTYGETMKARNTGIIRLVKKNSGSWERKVHEKFRVHGSQFMVHRLKNYLNHYPHQTVREFLQEVNFYSTLRAKELFGEGKKTNMFAIFFYPLAKFIWTYFLKMGFLDGPPGFAYAFFMSFHSFLVRAKLYQYDLKKAT